MTTIEQEALAIVKRAAKKYVDSPINWEQRRYEIAKAALPAISHWKSVMCVDDLTDYAIMVADNLINKLKKTKGNGQDTANVL